MVYCEAKRILIAYENKQGSIQSLISQSQCQHKKSLTCLIMKTLCYKKLLDKIIKKSKLLEQEKFLGDKLAQMLVYDVLFGMGVRGKFKSSMKRNYASLTNALEHYMNKYECETREDLLKKFDSSLSPGEDESNPMPKLKPKYIYVNQLTMRKKEILTKLKEHGFELVKFEASNDDDAIDFKEKLKNLGECEFMKDEHVKALYIFRHDSRLNKENPLFNEGLLLQIDKSSCLAPMVLDPPVESHIIDGASAPGNKTILLANIMKNTGLIHAFDLDEARVKQMSDNLKQHHVKNVRLKCMDFLETDVSKYDRVSHVLLDVPCSGSGMVNRLKFGDTELELIKDKQRLRSLEALQRKMLLHAMSLDNVERIVYSTCSVHEEENEHVVKYALQNCDQKFTLVNLFEHEKAFARGICHDDQDSQELNLNYCLRLNFTDNFTNGFFIACFQSNNNNNKNTLDSSEMQES